MRAAWTVGNVLCILLQVRGLLRAEGTVWILLLFGATLVQATNVVRETKLGKVRGNLVRVDSTDVEEYIGIPFAEPPVGNLRFKEPVPKTPWKGTWNATNGETICHQVLHPNICNNPAVLTEDCLHLNVWAPANAAKSAVLVYIHGGGFAYGSATLHGNNGLQLAASTGVVVASMNYRLGILGFLNANSPDAPGNQGLLDQHLALKWIQENIDVFGGDPARVTIIGSSAGSMSVHAHILSPLSKGLFKRAVMLSGSHNNLDFIDSTHGSVVKGDNVAKLLGCSRHDKDLITHPDDVLRCLRSKTAEELALATSEIFDSKEFTFFPTFNDRFLPKVPTAALERGFFQNIDVIVGVTSDECASVIIIPTGSVILRESFHDIEYERLERALKDVVLTWAHSDLPELMKHYLVNVSAGEKQELTKAYLDYLSDRIFNCPAQFFSEKHAARKNAVYSFVFAHRSRKDGYPSWMGAPHHTTGPYLFLKPFREDNEFTEEDKTMSYNFARLITSFSENGTPVLPDGTPWPKFIKETPISIVIGSNTFTPAQGYRKEHCEAWREVL
ncbi:unnamed protein product [Ixodes persulcatus]